MKFLGDGRNQTGLLGEVCANANSNANGSLKQMLAFADDKIQQFTTRASKTLYMEASSSWLIV
jgi:hypothetical protein